MRLHLGVVVAVMVVASFARAEPDATTALAAAKQLHAAAQAAERACAPVDRACQANLPPQYEAAARAYGDYLARFASAPEAVEARFYRAEILELKLGHHEAAGDDYLVAGKSAGPLQRDALVKAVIAYDAARGPTANPIDDKLRAAVDAYAAAFAGGPDVVMISFRIGKLDLDRGKLDDAIRSFATIATRYPAAPEAGAAGDLWLRALVAKSDFAAIDAAVTVLEAQPAFASPDQRARLEALRSQAVMKLAGDAAAAHAYAKAAELYERVARTPDPKLAVEAATNAAVMFQQAKLIDRAAAAYRAIVDRFPTDPAAPRALFAVATIEQVLAVWEGAADDYERLASTYPRDAQAVDALYNAGLLRRALGQRDRAIALLGHYVAQVPARGDAARVALEIARLHEDTGDHAGALQAYIAVAATYRGDRVALEALVGSGRVALALGRDTQATTQLADATALAAAMGSPREHARLLAELAVLRARLVQRAADQISLAVAPAQLSRALASKAKLWAEADHLRLSVVELGDVGWAITALYETAATHEQIATAIDQLPGPSQLSPAEQAAYRAALVQISSQLRAKAIDSYRVAYAKAISLGVYGADTLACRDALIRLGALPADPSARAGVRLPSVEPAPVLAIQPR